MQESVKKRGNDSHEGELVRPDYYGRSIANIPATIMRLLRVPNSRVPLSRDVLDVEDGTRPMKVVLILVDGFGYNMWTRHRSDAGLWQAMSERGKAVSLTSVFPSTTAAAITTLNSGLTPQEHGLPEWAVYMREIDRVINTLPFQLVDSPLPDELLRYGVDPRILYNGSTIYEELDSIGIDSYTLSHKTIAHSAYSSLIHRGSTIVPFNDAKDMADKVRETLEDKPGQSFTYVYYDGVDHFSHKAGPDSKECQDEITALSQTLWEECLETIAPETARDTVLMVTSDHGQIAVVPEQTEYMNEWSDLARTFEASEGERLIPPTGSARDVFLHIRPERLEDACRILGSRIGDRARVMRITDAFRQGLFGMGTPKREFIDRVGNLLVIPSGSRLLWWEHSQGKKFELKGMHGGLSPEEMLVPFAHARLSELR